MKKFHLLLLMSVLLWSCVKPLDTIIVSSISLNKSAITLTEGDSETLTATIKPDNATNKKYSWKSSDSAVASVSADGKVTAIKPGSATITVTTEDGGKTASCQVTVNARSYAVESISLNKSVITLTEGDSETLTATIKPDNATNKKYSWKSSDDKIATIAADGKVTAIKPGSATITVTTEDGGKTASCQVTVKARIYPVESISLNKSAITLTEGDSETLTATIKPDNATNKNYSWKSSDDTIATIAADGKVTANKPGSATITVTTEDGGKTASCQVTVKAKPELTVAKTSYEVDYPGEIISLEITANIDYSIIPSADWITVLSGNRLQIATNSDYEERTGTVTIMNLEYLKWLTVTVKQLGDESAHNTLEDGDTIDTP